MIGKMLNFKHLIEQRGISKSFYCIQDHLYIFYVISVKNHKDLNIHKFSFLNITIIRKYRTNIHVLLENK